MTHFSLIICFCTLLNCYTCNFKGIFDYFRRPIHNISQVMRKYLNIYKIFENQKFTRFLECMAACIGNLCISNKLKYSQSDICSNSNEFEKCSWQKRV